MDVTEIRNSKFEIRNEFVISLARLIRNSKFEIRNEFIFPKDTVTQTLPDTEANSDPYSTPKRCHLQAHARTARPELIPNSEFRISNLICRVCTE